MPTTRGAESRSPARSELGRPTVSRIEVCSSRPSDAGLLPDRLISMDTQVRRGRYTSRVLIVPGSASRRIREEGRENSKDRKNANYSNPANFVSRRQDLPYRCELGRRQPHREFSGIPDRNRGQGLAHLSRRVPAFDNEERLNSSQGTAGRSRHDQDGRLELSGFDPHETVTARLSRIS